MPKPELSAIDFFVAENGNDEWSGTVAEKNDRGTDGPFATLSRAKDAVRALKGDQPDRNYAVAIRGGVYSLRETLVFGLNDAAAPGHTITYAAYPGETPVLSSGVPIRNWRQLSRNRPIGLTSFAKAKVWVADLPEHLALFRTLYDGAKRLTRARSPGFVPTQPPLPWDFLYQQDLEPFSYFEFPAGAVKNWPNLSDVELVIRPSYPFTMNILPLESVDEIRCRAKTAVQGGYPLRALLSEFHSSWEQSAWIENVLEGIDGPGRWAVNTQERKVYLWPEGEEPGENIVAPCLKELVRVEGNIDFDGPRDVPTRGITFRGITFTQADRGVVENGDVAIQHDWEMIDKGDSLLRLRGAEDCAVEECRFIESGGSAIRLDLHCLRNRISSNEISRLGGAGIILIGYGPGTKNVNKENEVTNNHIHHCGLVYWHAHGIILWQSGSNRVAHNTIHHMPRKAICLSGVRPWLFGAERGKVRECTDSIRWHEIADPEAAKACGDRIGWHRDMTVTEWPEVAPYLHTKDNTVALNELYRTSEVLGDGSVINITGAGNGNIIRRNYIHDIHNPHIHGAIRTDDFQRGTLIEENVVFRTSSHGLCLRHQVETINNFIVDVRPGAYIWIGERPFDGSRIERNILFHPGGQQTFYPERHMARKEDVYEHLGIMKNGTVDNNLYCNLEALDLAPRTIEKLQARGREANGVYADPMFEDWENGDFRLKPGSPALKMGIVSIDVGEAGITDAFPERYLTTGPI